MTPAEFAAWGLSTGGVAYVNGVVEDFDAITPSNSDLERLRHHARVFKAGVEQKFDGVTEALASGATVFFKNVHRKAPTIGSVVEEIARATSGSAIQATLVCSSNLMSHGYDPHQDDRELVVMQLVGTKHWTVYARGEQAEVSWQSTLQEGDMLYVPTGWWHFVEPRTLGSRGLTMHLTISFRK